MEFGTKKYDMMIMKSHEKKNNKRNTSVKSVKHQFLIGKKENT